MANVEQLEMWLFLMMTVDIAGERLTKYSRARLKTAIAELEDLNRWLTLSGTDERDTASKALSEIIDLLKDKLWRM